MATTCTSQAFKVAGTFSEDPQTSSQVVPFKGFSNYACPFAFLADRLETAQGLAVPHVENGHGEVRRLDPVGLWKLPSFRHLAIGQY